MGLFLSNIFGVDAPDPPRHFGPIALEIEPILSKCEYTYLNGTRLGLLDNWTSAVDSVEEDTSNTQGEDSNVWGSRRPSTSRIHHSQVHRFTRLNESTACSRVKVKATEGERTAGWSKMALELDRVK